MRPISGSSPLRPSKERLNKIVGLLNYSISAAALNIFGTEAPHVFLEVGRVALDKLRQEGIVFTGRTPLETINNIYSYFTSHGYFKAAAAKELAEKKAANGPCLVELRESWIKDCHISCPVKGSGKPGSHTCFCYNVMRYALWSDFSMELQFLESARGKKDDDIVIKAALVPVDKETLKSWRLMDEIARREVMLKKAFNDVKHTVEMSLDAIISADDARRITVWNSAAEQMFGYTEAEAVGMTIETLMPKKYLETHRKGFMRFINTGTGVVVGKTTELEGKKKDGVLFPLELSLSADRNNGRWEFTALVRNITERKRLAAEMNQKITEMERLIRHMVGRELKMEELRKEIRLLKESGAARPEGTQ